MNKLRLITPIILAVLASCASKESVENTQATSIDFSYEVDTVMVDAGDEFIYIQSQLATSDLTTDGKYLYNFKRGATEPGLEVIDLENLKLERVIPMSLDGPNAIRSQYVSHVYMLPDNSFYLSDNYEVYHFDQDGNKLFTLNYAKQDFDGEKLPDGKRIQLKETLTDDGKTLLALYGGEEFEALPEGLAIFDLENKTVNYKPIDLFKALEKYQTVFYYDGKQPIQSYGAAVYLTLQNDSLIYTNSAENKAYFYDLKTDSLTSVSYSSQFTRPEAIVNYSNRSDSEAEFEEVVKLVEQSVKYRNFLFDETNQVYWRFSKDLDHMAGEKPIFKTVLTAFDTRFNQLGEQLLPEEFELAFATFIKNGMIYTFLNIDDEVAFVRLKPTISFE